MLLCSRFKMMESYWMRTSSHTRLLTVTECLSVSTSLRLAINMSSRAFVFVSRRLHAPTHHFICGPHYVMHYARVRACTMLILALLFMHPRDAQVVNAVDKIELITMCVLSRGRAIDAYVSNEPHRCSVACGSHLARDALRSTYSCLSMSGPVYVCM